MKIFLLCFIVNLYLCSYAFNIEEVIYQNVSILTNEDACFCSYQFEIENDQQRILLSCPGCNSSQSDRLLRCDLNFTSVATSCIDVTPTMYSLTSVDGFGLTTTFYSRTIITCAVLTASLCSATVQQLGACYEGTDYGAFWSLSSFTPPFVCPESHVDIVFLLDGSSSINQADPTNFDTVKQWVKNVTQKFDIAPGGSASVGVVQYSTWLPQHGLSYIVTEIEIGQYKDFPSFSTAMDAITLQGKTTYTAAALRVASEEFAKSVNFNESDTKKVLVLLTDGRSNDFVDLNASSIYVRNQNITIFAVGVKAARLNELQIVSNGVVGSNERVYQLLDFDRLDSIVGSIFTAISASSLEASAVDETNELRFGETGLSAIFDSPVYSIKLVVIGDIMVGKTSLFIRYVTGEFPDIYVPTVMNYDHEVQSEEYILQHGLFDTGGGEDYEKLRPLIYPQTNAFILCFSVETRDFFSKVKSYYKPELEHNCPLVPIVVVDNKIDLRTDQATIDQLEKKGEKPIITAKGRQIAEEIGAAKYVECSSLTGEGVQEAFEQIGKIALEHLRAKKLTKKKTCGML